MKKGILASLAALLLTAASAPPKFDTSEFQV